jgi:hypothetical protein
LNFLRVRIGGRFHGTDAEPAAISEESLLPGMRRQRASYANAARAVVEKERAEE